MLFGLEREATQPRWFCSSAFFLAALSWGWAKGKPKGTPLRHFGGSLQTTRAAVRRPNCWAFGNISHNLRNRAGHSPSVGNRKGKPLKLGQASKRASGSYRFPVGFPRREKEQRRKSLRALPAVLTEHQHHVDAKDDGSETQIPQKARVRQIWAATACQCWKEGPRRQGVYWGWPNPNLHFYLDRLQGVDRFHVHRTD